MKKLIFVLTLFVVTAQAQELKQTPQISVSGEGKISVTPDEAIISVAVENTGKDATEVKKKNDEIIDKVLKLIKKSGIPSADYQTQQVNLYKNYDYIAKKHSFVANQSLSIHLKDLSKYNQLMMDLLDSGINSIQGVAFKSSKIKEFERQARKNAIEDAIQKAADYVSMLPGQKVGKALQISDQSFTNYPRPVFAEIKTMAMADTAETPRETLVVGEIEITATVAVIFVLE
jgi:uncharacterized protein YggE